MNIKTNKSILHIGLQKTGSSYLQRFVFRDLCRKIRYSYVNDTNQFREVKRFSFGFTPQELNEFSRQFEVSGRYFLSYEGLIGARPECWEERADLIKALFGDVAIIIAIRDPYDYLDSLFLQKVKEGQFLYEREFLDVRSASTPLGYIRHAFSIFDFDFVKLESVYKSRFEEVYFVPFESLTASNVFVNGERIVFNNETVTNRSLSRVSIKLIRFLGFHFPRLSRIFNENINLQDFYSAQHTNNQVWSKPRLSYSFIARRLIDKVFKGKRYMTNFEFTPEQLTHMDKQRAVYQSLLEAD